ncbi:MAG: acyl-CoA dehydrogenase family protein [candidate division WOR-3 bacterium]
MDFNFSDDAQMVRQTVHEFVRRDLLPREPAFLNAKTQAEREELSRSATNALKETGLYSAGVPEEFGGGGLGPIETCIIASELSQTVIPVEWGEPTPILYECSEAQRADWLLPVVRGDKNYALAFRDPDSTSPSTPSVSAKPQNSGFVLNGTKLLSRTHYDFCLVFAPAEQGPTCFILNRDAPGSSIRITVAGAELVLEDCHVPATQVLGEPGRALQLGQKWFGLSRVVRASQVVGVCERLLEVTAQYARDWTQMGEHISDRKSVFQSLAEMAADIAGLRWLVFHAAWLVAEGRNVTADSMLAKLHSQRVLNESVNRSIRIHGGTNPPFDHWLLKASTESEALDMLRLAVARQVMAESTPS